jgi:hypothetical protein
MADTAETLLQDGKCFACLDERQMAMVQLALLLQLTGVTMTPTELLAEAKCFACLDQKQMAMVQLQLLSLIVDNGGGGGGGNVTGTNYRIQSSVFSWKNVDTALWNPGFSFGPDGTQGVSADNGVP